MLKNSILISYKWTPKFRWVKKRHHLGFALRYSSKSKTKQEQEGEYMKKIRKMLVIVEA